MKIVLALLILFSSEIYAQQPIEIKEGESPRQVTSFTCGQKGEVDSFGIPHSYFTTAQASMSTTNVSLVKIIDLHNGDDFPVISGNECLKQVDLSNIAVVVKCPNPEFIENRTVRITPKRVQDPYICNTTCRNFSNPLNVNIPENTAAGSEIEKFKLCSNDINVKTSLIGIKITGILEEKNKDTLVLRTKQDYESQPHDMKSEVSIDGKSVLNISISILDSDDLGVTFSKTFYECQIPENTKGYITNCDVKAEDMDKGINAAVGYSIISVTPTAEVFDILHNGSLMLKQPLNRENTSLYRIYIKGYQLDRQNDSANYTTLQVRVTDVNDNPPVVSAGDCGSTTVFENSRIGTIVCQLSYTDADEGKNAKNEFHVTGNGNKFLEVEKETGFLKVKSLIDRESNEIRNPITFEVYAAPVGDSTAKRSNIVSVNVTVLDENDNSPSFTNAEMTINIRKTQALDVKLTQIRATDPDENENGKVNYTLLNGNNLFNLDPKSGILTLTVSLNESFQSVYHLTIRATDQCVDAHNQRSSVMFLTVKVDDVNVHTPYFFSNMSKTVNISEDAPIGTIVMEIKAGDKDPTDVLTFSLLGDQGKFVLEDKLLKIKDGLDREKKDNYNLSVSVNDSVHVTTTFVDVIVIDVNDNSPNFQQKTYTFNVTEEVNNAAVGFVKADDPDFGDNGKVEYYIDKNSPWISNFTVKVMNKRCEIRTRGKIDREKIENGHNIQFFVFAKDLGSPQRTNSSSVEITVLDINDHVPQFVKTFPNTFTVKEDTTNLSNVFQVSAFDPDYGENGQVLYRIRQGTKAAGLFKIDSTSGLISLKSSPKIEACNDSVYVITVEAFNQIEDRKYSVLNITCSIEDVNNHKPVFDYLRTSSWIMESNHLTTEDIDVCFNVSEMHLHNTPCKHPAASDADCLESYSKLFYWMDNNDDRFKINSSTGIISIKKGSLLDFDTLPHRNKINFTIYATDGLYTTNKTLTFSIMNRQDSLPEFSKETFLCSVDECPDKDLSCSLTLRNENDALRENQFRYNLSQGVNNTNFQLKRNGKKFEIVLTTCFDFEKLTNNTFILEVQVFSLSGDKGSSCKVIITIKNINDNAPVFGNSTYKYNILETYSAGSVLGRISASDADNLGNITYTLEQNEYLTYTGEILKLKKVPDLDKGALKSPISGKIYAFDGIHNVSTSLEITVKAVNEYPPVFKQLLYNVTVQENAKSNVKLQAHDNDAGKDGNIAQYVLHIPEKWNKNITLENDTVVILGFDRDIMGSSSMIQFTVEAVDGGAQPKTGEALVEIIVEGINDNIPKFPTDERTVYIYRLEGATIGVIYTAKAIDKDIGAGSNVLYRLNPTHHSFQINETSGIVSCTEDLFIDKDNKGRFNIVVEAFNEGSKKSDSLTIILKLTDGNNHSPVFDNCTTSFNLIETNETDVVVAVLSAHDEDKGRNGIITFSLLEDTANSPFRVFNRTNSTCVVKTVRSVDREHQDTYNLVVKATDNGINNRTSFCNLQVNILDVNDNYPKFDGSSSFYGRVKENSMQNTSIHPPTIIVTDPDSGDNGTAGLFFKFNDSSAPFCIQKTKHSLYMNVSIYVCGNIDREEKAIYHLSIIANDLKGSKQSLTATASLTIEILDENDETPQFNKTHYEYNITENTFTSEIVGKVAAFDRDEKDVLVYGIVSGDLGRFFINQSGIIFVSGDVDREIVSNYTLNVSVSDGVHRNFTVVTITIIDKNDNPPKFLMYTYEEAVDIEIEENAQPGIIFNATATDQDETGSENSKVIYSLDVNQKGDGLNLFNISEDGTLYLMGPLDRETEDYYEVNVTATDMGKPSLSTSISVHVKVLDVNDNRPEICVDGQCNVSSSNSYTIEKVPKYSVLKLIGSRDNDKGENSTVSFSIESTDISKHFQIDNNTGVVSIAEPLIVNNLIHEGLVENNGSVILNLTIVATDGGGLNATLALHVYVEPINDDDVPVFSETVFKFNISETTSTGVVVGNCSATSKDANSHMTYELISGYGRDLPTFEIDANTGNIKTKVPLDRETIDRYTLAVQVRDGRVPERTAFASVEITVDDINDNSPTFDNDNVTIFVNENAELSIQKNVSASDKDIGLNAEITYTLNVTNDAGNGDYDGSFNVSENGILTVAGKFDYEQQRQYDLVVTATDKGNNPRKSTAEVHIVVLDKNDNSPKFHNVEHFFNIFENETSSKIFTANATDEDSGLNGQIVYKLLNTGDAPFVIDPFNGEVSLQGKLDYETRNNYTLCVIAEDFGTPRKMSTLNVTISIKDVYDDELFFLKDTFDVIISRESKVNSSILNLTISVPEANFSLTGPDSEYFSVGKTSGELFLKKTLDSKRDVYMIRVFAEDKIRQTASAMVIVYATGHQVIFDKPEIKLHLRENINGTSILVDLNTTEEFSSTGVEYTIVEVKPQADRVFKVNKTTGVVTCTQALNREHTAQFTILISAEMPKTRKKREVQKPSSVISLIVDVDDVNDNPPYFPSDQDKVFGVPDNARENYPVGTIKAEDPDISDMGRMKYVTIGGRTDVFGIDEDSGDIFTLVAISNTRTYKFNLLIRASDGDDMQNEAELNVTIHVVPTKNQPMLLVNMTVAEFKKREFEYRRNMSEILGVSIQFEKIELHQITDSYGRTKIDLSRTDLRFHGINGTTGMLVPNAKMKLLIENNMERLASLFGQKFDIRVASVDTIADPSAITASQILFICMAVFIFFGSLTALVVSQYSWMRYETERQVVDKTTKRFENEMELSSMRSRRSRKHSREHSRQPSGERSRERSSITAAAAINQAYAETEITTSSPLSSVVKTKPQYESQELRVEINEELLEADLNDINIPDAAQSVSGSGEENISFHNDDNNPSGPDSDKVNNENLQIVLDEPDQLFLNGEGPIMASSPRPSRDSRQVGVDPTSDLPGSISKHVDINEGEESTRERGGSILLLDATGEAETDDIVNDGDASDPKGSSDKIAKYLSSSEGQTIDFEKESEYTHETAAPEGEMEEKCNEGESFKEETESFIESTTF